MSEPRKCPGNISLPRDVQSPCPGEPDYNNPHFPPIVNTQRAMYESQLHELHERTSRLEERNEALEKFLEYGSMGFDAKGAEAEKEIVGIYNEIALLTKKNEELQKKYDDLDAKRQKQLQNHLNKVNEMNENFENTRKQFNSEIKKINAEIKTIEQFKLQEEALRAKYNKQQKELIQREEDMQKKLEAIELKSKMHKESLKQEVYKHILELSTDFQDQLKLAMPLNVQRLMRENIMLQNEYIRLHYDKDSMLEYKSNFKFRIEDFVSKIKDAKINNRRRLVSSKVQSLLLKKLKIEHSKVKNVLSKSFKTPENFEKKYLDLIENQIKPEVKNFELRRRKLEVLLHQERIKLGFVNNFKTKTEFAIKACRSTLGVLKNIVDSTLLLNKPTRDELFKDMELETLADSLLNIIKEGDAKMWVEDTESVDTVPDAASAYAAGDLGFEPKQIEIEDVAKEPPEIRSTSELSTVAILKELEQLQEQIPTDKVEEGREKSSRLSTDESTVESEESEKEKPKEKDILSIYEERYEDEEEGGYNYEDYLTDFLNYAYK